MTKSVCNFPGDQVLEVPGGDIRLFFADSIELVYHGSHADSEASVSALHSSVKHGLVEEERR